MSAPRFFGTAEPERGARPRRASPFAAALALALVSAAGCGADHRAPEWEYISGAIMQPDCASSSCHSRAAAAAGLDFSDPDRGYTSLTGLWIWIIDPNGTASAGCKQIDDKGTIACQREHRSLVIPFDPAQSRLVNVLRARDAPRMPPDRPLPEADIELVERWIQLGALRRGDDTGGDAGTTGTAAADAASPDADGGADAGAGDGT